MESAELPDGIRRPTIDKHQGRSQVRLSADEYQCTTSGARNRLDFPARAVLHQMEAAFIRQRLLEWLFSTGCVIIWPLEVVCSFKLRRQG